MNDPKGVSAGGAFIDGCVTLQFENGNRTLAENHNTVKYASTCIKSNSNQNQIKICFSCQFLSASMPLLCI